MWSSFQLSSCLCQLWLLSCLFGTAFPSFIPSCFPLHFRPRNFLFGFAALLSSVGVLLAGDVPHSPLDVRVRVSLDEGVDGSDDAGLVSAVVVRVGAGRLEVGRRDGVVHRRAGAPKGATHGLLGLAAVEIVSWLFHDEH